MTAIPEHAQHEAVLAGTVTAVPLGQRPPSGPIAILPHPADTATWAVQAAGESSDRSRMPPED
ncbi:hypothetical protein [Cryobacterium sp. 10C3]|uniref:hypothetical protein n=1 Tax=Cryobacterium sp. 10C3 TaxID=3048577 RepID=UPI002AB371B9|nr:hypothetical protein [Cryobacterium sp. 10C3]MDY7556592.1 hypothetical protein [Cryobacterium sp. 10C3]